MLQPSLHARDVAPRRDRCWFGSRSTPAGWDFLLVLVTSLFLVAATGEDSAAQAVGSASDSMDGEILYDASCANCHGADGRGASAALLGFDIPLPDFTDCAFASREPDADWVAVAHEGGPVRGFDPMMPAFGGALSVEQLEQVMTYIREFCGDEDWPRGELNLPRALVTEKAYPEDEAVWTIGADLDGEVAVTHEIVYERRFGARNQIEFVVPFTFRERAGPDATGWVGGIEDLVVGLKRDLYHSLVRGSILAGGVEIKLPTGDEDDGFGSGTPVFESFVSFGQILPSESFVQLQGVLELPFDTDRAENEGGLRVAMGRSFTEGPWGRTWTPMLEVLGGRELESGAETEWDLLPQVQVTLNTRQHLIANLGVRIPASETEGRDAQLLLYILWDWYDGGLFDGW